MRAYEAIAALPVAVEGYELERLEREVSSAFTRVTTVVRLHGAGEEGVGEDVAYDAADHPGFPRDLPLAGERTLDSFSTLLDGLDLWPAGPPGVEASRDYRRWALESAALDLALRQAGRSLGEVLGREPRPLRFVVSLRLPEPADAAPLRALLARYPGTRFKLDPTPSWDDAVCAELAALDAVDTVDLKGAYSGTAVDNPADPVLYRRVAEAFPQAWIEDPALTPETEPVLAQHRDRLTWDAPVHSTGDLDRLAPRRAVNVKPSRFGSVARLLDAYDWCAARGVVPYGGGQFELGPGRGQIQLLAALFHPDAPNDVAPAGYNDPLPADGLPRSPLPPSPRSTGFARAVESA